MPNLRNTYTQRFLANLALLLLVACEASDDTPARDASISAPTERSRKQATDASAETDGEDDGGAAMTPKDASVLEPRGGSGADSAAHGQAGTMASATASSAGALGAATAGAGMPSTAQAGRAGPSEPMPTDSNEIESVSFDRAQNGNPTPVLLFKGGYACWEQQLAASMPLDALAHRTHFPESWSTWRRTPEGIEVKRSRSWVELPFDEEFPPLKKGTHFSGLFEYVFSPDPTAEILLLQSTRYRFFEDGTFEYCYSSTITGSNVFRSERSPRAGRYEIDGYRVRLEDDAGLTDYQPFFHNPKYMNEIWVGEHYLSTSRLADQSVCD